MLFSFEEIIAHISRDETLMPGEFTGSGTMSNGCGLELGWYLENGDSVALLLSLTTEPSIAQSYPTKAPHCEGSISGWRSS